MFDVKDYIKLVLDAWRKLYLHPRYNETFTDAERKVIAEAVEIFASKR